MNDDLTNGLALIDEIRALSNAGLRYTSDPYQIERYRRIIEICAALMERISSPSISQATLSDAFFADLRYMTPYSVVDAAIFDEKDQILLIQRADNGLWALPGGACEVGETPATNAVREVWEETGCVADVTHFLGLFDNRLHGGRSMHHLYSLLFAGRLQGGEAQRTRETLAAAWYGPDQIPWQEMVPVHRPRVRYALRWCRNPDIGPFFDPVNWSPEPSWQHDLGDSSGSI